MGVADEQSELTGWNLIESDLSGPEALEQTDGFMGENPPFFRHEQNLDEMIAIDADNESLEGEVETTFDETPLAELATASPRSSVRLSAAELGLLEVADSTRGVPRGWRQDTFGDRVVNVLPWSTRPPDVFPALWTMMSQRKRQEVRADWWKDDPDAYRAEDARRRSYHELKRTREVPVCVTHRLTRQSTSTNHAKKLNRSDGSGGDRRLWERSSDDGETVLGTGVVIDLLREAKTKTLSGHFDLVMLEIKNDEKFFMSQDVPSRALHVNVAPLGI